MKLWLHRVEHVVDRVIPFSLILLFLLIIAELFFLEEISPYESWVGIIDNGIILLFLIDLAFKFHRSHSIPEFLGSHWLEIIAVLPVFVVVRVFELFLPLTRLDLASDAAHGIIEAQTKWGIIVREAEYAGQASRLAILSRFARPLLRFPRFIRAFTFYERPTGRHHPHE